MKDVFAVRRILGFVVSLPLSQHLEEIISLCLVFVLMRRLAIPSVYRHIKYLSCLVVFEFFCLYLVFSTLTRTYLGCDMALLVFMRLICLGFAQLLESKFVSLVILRKLCLFFFSPKYLPPFFSLPVLELQVYLLILLHRLRRLFFLLLFLLFRSIVWLLLVCLQAHCFFVIPLITFLLYFRF